MNIKKLLSMGVIVLFTSVIALGALDLQFTSEISMIPANIQVGSDVTFSVSFKASGSAVSNLKIIFGIDEWEYEEHVFDTIPADSIMTDSFIWTVYTNNPNHIVWFVLDPEHTTGDSNYSNNRIEKTITVTCPEPINVKFIPPIAQSIAHPTAGDIVNFSVAVTYTGIDNIERLDVLGSVDNEPYKVWSYTNFEPHQVETVSLPWTATGGYHILWFELYPNPLSHFDEEYSTEDNAIVKSFKVGSGQPDLIVEVQVVSLSRYGEALSIDVKNIGTADSVASEMQIKKWILASGSFPNLRSRVLFRADIPPLGRDEVMHYKYPIPRECIGIMSVEADTNNTNTELNEKNNIWVKLFRCFFNREAIWPFFKSSLIATIHLPESCKTCPPWHMKIHKNDPMDILNDIVDKLSNNTSFKNIKGDWEKFLEKTNGLNPNTAIEIILNKTLKSAEDNLKTVEDINKFQEGLNNVLKQMADFAKEKLSGK